MPGAGPDGEGFWFSVRASPPLSCRRVLVVRRCGISPGTDGGSRRRYGGRCGNVGLDGGGHQRSCARHIPERGRILRDRWPKAVDHRTLRAWEGEKALVRHDEGWSKVPFLATEAWPILDAQFRTGDKRCTHRVRIEASPELASPMGQTVVGNKVRGEKGRSSGIGKLLGYYRSYKYDDHLQIFMQRNYASAMLLRLFQRWPIASSATVEPLHGPYHVYSGLLATSIQS